MSIYHHTTKKTEAYAMLRYCIDGYHFIDTETISCLPSIAKEKADDVDKQCGPAWAQNNKAEEIQKILVKLA